VISYKNKFLFIHVPRQAGTSIESYLTEAGTAEIELPRDEAIETDILRFQHVHAARVMREFEDRDFSGDDYFKFSFTRNPWDRLVSFFFYDHLPKIATDKAEDITFAEWVKRRISRTPFTFEPYDRNELLFGALGDKPKEIRRVAHTLGFWLLDNYDNILVDYVGRFENLQKDFDTICDRLNISRGSLKKLRACGDDESCPWHKERNISIPKHEHYTKYYDDETLEIVNCMFQQEADMFGYKFGD
jgi:hypothetical protein